MTGRTIGGIQSQTPLKIYNTITRQKEELKVEGHFLKWYTCGPTVYDSAHIGHARSYIMLDIIRKTLERYFGYNITYIMNITDIDDKIIAKAQEHLSSLPADIHEQFSRLSVKLAEETEEQKRIHVASQEVSRKYEAEFFADMQALGVDLPSYTTRVSEYVDEVVKFIEGIERNGYTYVCEGSVYFDVQKYRQTHKYPLMCHTASQEDQQALLEEGEGKLAAGHKKNKKEDFVLWKASKHGEPAWSSKWGAGRPGWHIECSAMAVNISGGRIDMHSGGIDLMFPHHDNEIAQSEGFGINDWVGHFLHTGHLHIDGMKMSKSLKNFIKIEELLTKGTARELRMLFILQKYSGPMTYSEDSLERAKVMDSKIFRYISLYAVSAQEAAGAGSMNVVKPFTDEERGILEEFERTVEKIDLAIKDDLNFPAVIKLAVSLTGMESRTGVREIHQQIAAYLKTLMHRIGLDVVQEPAKAADPTYMVELIGNFRNKVRDLTKASASKKEYFAACDEIRKELAEKGFLIEDATSQTSASMRKKC
ncbi:cysteinyl-tRNA synthetase [Nematocida major]|uniref:cysteinyl-tRNA synthetase n=1 Tax=Nematocida major TaxID=1912982 RepID=UPI0020079746|nr:cysteinyl-tRNA synthetase [Nematocida major]KAH9386436.1 cysteinyl-tRNA synthetase [Nematocida major]